MGKDVVQWQPSSQHSSGWITRFFFSYLLQYLLICCGWKSNEQIHEPSCIDPMEIERNTIKTFKAHTMAWELSRSCKRHIGYVLYKFFFFFLRGTIQVIKLVLVLFWNVLENILNHTGCIEVFLSVLTSTIRNSNKNNYRHKRTYII